MVVCGHEKIRHCIGIWLPIGMPARQGIRKTRHLTWRYSTCRMPSCLSDVLQTIVCDIAHRVSISHTACTYVRWRHPTWGILHDILHDQQEKTWPARKGHVGCHDQQERGMPHMRHPTWGIPHEASHMTLHDQQEKAPCIAKISGC